MKTIEINQVIATHRHEWKKWPDTDDKDYSDVFENRTATWIFRRGDYEIKVNSRFYPVYSAYVAAGDLNLPIQFPIINNLYPPSQAVIDQQRRDLKKFSQEGCTSILWEHCHQCFPQAVFDLPDLFKLRIISFGDDCPGSSDIKTFPVAASFNAICYSMDIWNSDDGSLTADEYQRRGLAYTRFCPMTMTQGLLKGLENTGFSIEKKQKAIMNGTTVSDLVFVGFQGVGDRKKLMHGLALYHAKQKQLDLTMKLYGMGLPDGVLEPRDPPHPMGLGYPMTPIYASALASVNVPVSSLFNCRLPDLFFSGVVQFVLDKWGELPKHGFVDGEHYISFDGTADDLISKVRDLKAHPERAAIMIEKAYQKAKEFWAENSWTNAYTDIYFDHLGVLS